VGYPPGTDDLLTFNGASRRDPRVEAWLSVADPLRFLARQWFERMRACGPDVLELFHDGGPVACVAEAPFAYVNVFARHASVGFYQGASLRDPLGLLEGSGKRMRHVKLRPGHATDVDALGDLIDAAYIDIRRRLGLLQARSGEGETNDGDANRHGRRE
jgi:hypothetical protein